MESTTSKKTTAKPSPANSEDLNIQKELKVLALRIGDVENKIGTGKMLATSDNDYLKQAVDRISNRLDVIQQWVESFHMYLTTNRITNTVDGDAEKDLTKVIVKLPDSNQPIFFKTE